MFTIRPHPRSVICGQTARQQLKAPVRLTRRSRSQSSGTWSVSWPTWSSVPALLTRMSTEPSSFTVRSTAAPTWPASVTSHLSASARLPIALISRAVSSVWTRPCARAACARGPYLSPSRESSDSTRMSAITRSAPARASVNASARPSPREPPVTKATRPERSISTGTPGRWGQVLHCNIRCARRRRAAVQDLTPLIAGQEDLARDDQPLDLRGALVDLEELRVTHELLDRVLLDVAVAAEDLDRVRGHLHRRVRGETLRERRLECRALALVEEP